MVQLVLKVRLDQQGHKDPRVRLEQLVHKGPKARRVASGHMEISFIPEA
jgi:hypothetical protein